MPASVEVILLITSQDRVGDPGETNPKIDGLADRFWSCVERFGSPDGCWPWRVAAAALLLLALSATGCSTDCRTVCAPRPVSWGNGLLDICSCANTQPDGGR